MAMKQIREIASHKTGFLIVKTEIDGTQTFSSMSDFLRDAEEFLSLGNNVISIDGAKYEIPIDSLKEPIEL